MDLPNLVAGGYFEEDEPLLRIDDRDYRFALERATAAVDRALAENEFATFELQRLREMEARNLISPSDVETGMRAARVTEAALADARAALNQAELDLSRTEVPAPFTGLVRSEQVDPGQFVSRGAAIARLYAVDYVEVRLPIADQQLAYLDIPPMQRGELDESIAPEVSLSADFAGRHYKWRGTIVRTEAEIDTRSRMVNAVARVRAADNAFNDPEYRSTARGPVRGGRNTGPLHRQRRRGAPFGDPQRQPGAHRGRGRPVALPHGEHRAHLR